MQEVKPIDAWSVEEVGNWLEQVVHLPQHAAAFAQHQIDGFLLCRLDASDLDDLGGLSRLDKTKVVRLC